MSTIAQRSFAGGEIAPALYARVDISKYITGLRTCRNFQIMRHGGAENRAGTQFICEVKDSSKRVKLIPFVFNNEQTYMLEFGDQYMRVIRNGAQVIDVTKNITAITQANPGVLTSNAHGFTNGQEVYVSGIVGMTQLNGRNLRVAGVTANTYTLEYLDGTAVNTAGFGAYTSGGTAARIYEIATDYVEADLQTLQFVQSADVMTITHKNYPVAELKRLGHANWTLTDVDFAPASPAVVASAATPGGTTGSTTYEYVVTRNRSSLGDESYASNTVSTASGNASISSTNYVDVTWSMTGAESDDVFNIYRSVNGVFGYVGSGTNGTFRDIGVTPDVTDTPPVVRDVFGPGDYPAAVTYIQQRLGLANTSNPEEVNLSRIGNFKNFSSSQPIQDDDAIKFTMAGRKVNAVRYMIDLGKLIIFTQDGEWAVEGEGGVLTPLSINPRQYSYNGAAEGLPPIVIGASALYVQGRGSIVRDLGFDYQIDGYTGNDLTIYSAHLFDKYSIRDWTFQQVPHSILWAVREDGTMLGLTYVREQQLLAWHRHDTDGYFEQVAVIPEGTQDVLYVVVEREINGQTKRYIERMTDRKVFDVIDTKILDSVLTYDGRNTTGGLNVTITGGTNWINGEALTMTASGSLFKPTDVDNMIEVADPDTGAPIRFTITGYTSATVVTGLVNRTLPVSLRGVSTELFAKAVKTVSGLYHLEGKKVSVFADRFVVANPNNKAYTERQVVNGQVTLDKPYTVIHVGLPITADIETLNIDTPQGETMADKKKIVSKVTMFTEDSRGAWIGGAPPPDESVDFLGGLTETKLRNSEGYDDPVALVTGTMDVVIEAQWNSNGRVFARCTDPVPLSLLAIAPAGMFPFRG